MVEVMLFVGIMMLVSGVAVLREVLYPSAGTPALKPFLEVVMSEDVVFTPAPAPSAVPGQQDELISTLLDDPIVRVRLVDLNVPFKVLLLFVFKLSLATALVWLGFALVMMVLLSFLGSAVGSVFDSTMSGIR